MRRLLMLSIACLLVACPTEDDTEPTPEPTPEVDSDADGSPDSEDCAPNDPSIYPGAPEGCDGVDTDCAGQPDETELDRDEDGEAPCAGDCDDTDDQRASGLEETCDGVDNDCDEVVPADEADADSDDAAADVYVGAPELCDGEDNDCDAATEYLSDVAALPESTGRTFGTPGRFVANRWVPASAKSVESIRMMLSVDAGQAITWMVWDAPDDETDPTLLWSATTTEVEGTGDSFEWLDAGDVDLTLEAGRVYTVGVWSADAVGYAWGEVSGPFISGGMLFDDEVAAITETEPVFGDFEDGDRADFFTQQILVAGETDDDTDGSSECEGDCDDGNLDRSPGAMEVCDGVDQDCDLELQGECDGLVITELIHSISGSDSNKEWFEVYNAGPLAIDLEGMTVDYRGYEGFEVVGSHVVQPNEYFLFGSSAVLENGPTADYDYDNAISMSSSGYLILSDASGGVHDILEWGYQLNFQNSFNRSITLDPASFDVFANDDAENWCVGQSTYSGSRYGSPGTANPTCVDD